MHTQGYWSKSYWSKFVSRLSGALKPAKWACAGLLLSAGSFAPLATGATASLPGLTPSGQPNFMFGDFSSKYFGSLTQATFALFPHAPTIFYASDTGDFSYNTSGGSFAGNGGAFSLFATLDPAGNVTSGKVVINGALPGFGITDASSLLFSADLTKFAFDSSLIGFDTNNITCHAAISGACTNAESVYLALDPSGAAYSGISGSLFSANVSSLTTVPLPGAALLFGSALVGLMGRIKYKQVRATA